MLILIKKYSDSNINKSLSLIKKYNIILEKNERK